MSAISIPEGFTEWPNAAPQVRGVSAGSRPDDESPPAVAAPTKTLRDEFAMAASEEEIESIVGTTIDDYAKLLGMDAKDYDWRIHYGQCLTKARYIWADTMLAARDRKEGK